MSKFILYYADGRIHSVCDLSPGSQPVLPDGLLCIETAHDVPPNRYVVNGVLEAIPAKPSPHHVFNYTTRQWEDPRTPETEWPLVRAQRSRLLAASDWTQLPDVPLATKDAWATYRQALRDITTQADPFNITWPPTP